jgi:predicted ATPase/DNA-binding SARP family transcriptional activator
MTPECWRIELLGELRACCGSQVHTRFTTHKIGGLLAYLALHRDRSHPREELIALFWPEADLDQGRISLRTALASLRRQLEPPGREPGSVLLADRLSVRLRTEAVATDVAEFDRLREESKSDDPQTQIERLTRALSLYRGDLLSGHYDEWTTMERERLSEARFDALRRLSNALEARGDYAQAVEFSRRVVQANPFDEAAHASLIRLYTALKRPSAAMRQYREWERILREEWNETPSQNVQSLVQTLRLGAAGEEDAVSSRTPLLSPPHAIEESVLHAAASLPPTPFAASLPAPFTTFFGRKEEIAQVLALLEQPDTRMVTLTGLGGSGKTRLALEVARCVQESGKRPVCFVSLVDITDARLIGETLRSRLRIGSSGQGDPLDLVAKALRDNPALLVLDNFEPLVEEGAEPVRRLLAACPKLTCLITSRVLLGVTGEWEFPVAPLPTPSAPGTPQHLMEFAGVQLFVSRAQAARTDFRITAANAQAVAELCHALEGLPLALELAAARISALTPAQMLQQMTNRFGFLVARHRDAAARHRTLRTALDWSYQALPEHLQRFITRLTVFRGGWNLSAAEAVCEEPAALDHLLELCDCSLITSEERHGEMRFQMLETVRAYCAEKRTQAGESESLRMRHSAVFSQLAEDAAAHQNGAEEARWLDRLEAEHDNLRAALDACQTLDAPEPGLRLVGSLWKFWVVRGHVLEGQRRMASVLARSEASQRTPERARALYGAGYLAWYRNDYALARAFITESLAIRREIGEQRGIAEALHRLGAMALFFQDYETARPLLEESLAIWQAQGDRLGLAGTLARLAEVKRGYGDYTTARALQEESLAIESQAGARWDTGYSLWGLGNIAYDQQDYAAAGAFYREALQAVRQIGDMSNIPFFMEPLGHLAVAVGQQERAVRLFGAAIGLRETLRVPALPESAATIESLLDAARSELGEKTFAMAWAEGRAMTVEQVVAYALNADGFSA